MPAIAACRASAPAWSRSRPATTASSSPAKPRHRPRTSLPTSSPGSPSRWWSDEAYVPFLGAGAGVQCRARPRSQITPVAALQGPCQHEQGISWRPQFATPSLKRRIDIYVGRQSSRHLRIVASSQRGGGSWCWSWRHSPVPHLARALSSALLLGLPRSPVPMPVERLVGSGWKRGHQDPGRRLGRNSPGRLAGRRPSLALLPKERRVAPNRMRRRFSLPHDLVLALWRIEKMRSLVVLVATIVAIAASALPAGSHEWYTGLRSPSGAPSAWASWAASAQFDGTVDGRARACQWRLPPPPRAVPL